MPSYLIRRTGRLWNIVVDEDTETPTGSPSGPVMFVFDALAREWLMAKYSVHIPEQTIIVDGDLLDGDPLTYWTEHYRSLIMWDPENGAFSQLSYTFNRVGD
jgi:hypothetical protein